MKEYLKIKVFRPLIELLTQGFSPKKLALSVALGFIIGIIPLMGVSTAICAVLALWLDLNIMAIQIVNYAAYPLQILFYIPFIKAGEKILGNPDSCLTITGITGLFDSGFINAVKVLWYANLQGILVWLMITIPAALAVYVITLALFRKIMKKQNR